MRFMLICLVLGLSAIAEARTGNELVADCKNDDSPTAFGVCLGYIQGAVEAQQYTDIMAQAVANNTGNVKFRAWFCMPKNVTLAQTKAIFLKHAENNPESLHLDAAFIVNIAVSTAFPCPAK